MISETDRWERPLVGLVIEAPPNAGLFPRSFSRDRRGRQHPIVTLLAARLTSIPISRLAFACPMQRLTPAQHHPSDCGELPTL